MMVNDGNYMVKQLSLSFIVISGWSHSRKHWLSILLNKQDCIGNDVWRGEFAIFRFRQHVTVILKTLYLVFSVAAKNLKV